MLQFNDDDNTMLDLVEHIDSFSIFSNGKEEIISKDNKKFFQLQTRVEEIFSKSRLMPAYCVSLHKETQDAKQVGDWLQINFGKEYCKNELPFSSLLFRLEETSGFNLIRLFNNKYDGRCLFLALDETVNLKNIVK